MRLQSPRVIGWYSATLGVAAGAVVYAYLGFGPVLFGMAIFGGISYFALTAVLKTLEEFSPYQKVSETIAVAGMVAFLPLILLADFLVALVVFLGMAQLALNFQTHDYRRFYVGMAVSFVGICVGAAEAKSGFYLVFFLAYTILAAITIGFAHVAQQQDAARPGWGGAARLRVCLLLVATATTLYLLLPRFPAGGLLAQPGSGHFYHDKKWEAEARKNDADAVEDQIDTLRTDRSDSRERDGSAGESRTTIAADDTEGEDRNPVDGFAYQGFEDQFSIDNPDAQGHRFSNRIVARMRSDRPQYLRARIFDVFDGLHWRSSSTETVKRLVGFNGIDLTAREPPPTAVLEHYEIFIEYDLGNYVPAAAVPVKLMFPATAVGIDLFGQIRSPGALKAGTAYAVTSQYNLIAGRRFAELDRQSMPTYTQLPADTDPRIRALAAEVTGGTSSQLAAAIALEQHLRTQYTYDLGSVFESQGTTPLPEFLFERRRGHCEYFASALAVMLRTRNISARLVTGFSATNLNPLTGYYDIHALDGHAWVEAFVDDLGWVILEPTAYYDGPVTEQPPLSAQQINEFVERQMRRQDTLHPKDLTLEAVVGAVWHLFYTLGSAGLAYVRLFVASTWPWLAGLAAIGIGGWLGWRRYAHLWRAHRLGRAVAAFQAEQPREAVAFYLDAIDELLRLAGFRHPPGQTIEQYLRHIEAFGSGRLDPILTDAFNRIHYNAEAGDHQVIAAYRDLFLSLYRMNFQRLQSVARGV